MNTESLFPSNYKKSIIIIVFLVGSYLGEMRYKLESIDKRLTTIENAMHIVAEKD